MNKQFLPWRYSLVPIYALRYGLAVFVPLYILSVGGTVLDVGIAIAIYYAVGVPASLAAGSLLDRTNRTKPFIVIPAAFSLLVVLAFMLPGSILSTWLYYALYSVLFSMMGPAISILVMGRHAVRKKMPKYYSKFSIFSLTGMLLASMFGVAIPNANLPLYTAFLVFFSVLSIALTSMLLRDQPVYESAELRRRRRLLQMSMLLHHGNATDYGLVRRLRLHMRDRKTKSLYQLFLTMVLFSTGIYMFVGSYVPFQVASGLSYSNVFLVQLLYAAAELASFIAVIEVIKRPMLHRYFVNSSRLGGAAFVAILLSVFLPVTFLFGVNLLAYAIAGIAVAFWNLSSTVLLYHRIKGKDEGHYLGLRSSLGCISAIVGSFASGIISSTLGYAVTFSIVALLVVASGIVFSLELNRR